MFLVLWHFGQYGVSESFVKLTPISPHLHGGIVKKELRETNRLSMPDTGEPAKVRHCSKS